MQKYVSKDNREFIVISTSRNPVAGRKNILATIEFLDNGEKKVVPMDDIKSNIVTGNEIEKPSENTSETIVIETKKEIANEPIEFNKDGETKILLDEDKKDNEDAPKKDATIPEFMSIIAIDKKQKEYKLNTLEEFNNFVEDNKLDKEAIDKCLNKTQKTHKGFAFKYE